MTTDPNPNGEMFVIPPGYEVSWVHAEPVKLSLIRRHLTYLCGWTRVAGDEEAGAITLLLYVPGVHSFCRLLLVLPEAVQQITQLTAADLPRSIWFDGEAVIIDGGIDPSRIPLKRKK